MFGQSKSQDAIQFMLNSMALNYISIRHQFERVCGFVNWLIFKPSCLRVFSTLICEMVFLFDDDVSQETWMWHRIRSWILCEINLRFLMYYIGQRSGKCEALSFVQPVYIVTVITMCPLWSHFSRIKEVYYYFMGVRAKKTTAKIRTSLFFMTSYWQCNIIVLMLHWAHLRVYMVQKKIQLTFSFTESDSWLINRSFQSRCAYASCIEGRWFRCNIDENRLIGRITLNQILHLSL